MGSIMYVCTSRVPEMWKGLQVYWMTTQSNKVGVVSGYSHLITQVINQLVNRLLH